jgi:glucokinase
MSAPRAIGIDVGGTKILAGLVERDGTVVAVERRPTPVGSAEEFLGGLAGVVDALRDDSVAIVGIGIPSTVDQRDGTSVFSVHVPIAHVPLRARGEEYLGLPVVVDNDANAAAVAEWMVGAGKGTSDMIMLTDRRAPPVSSATWCSSSTGRSVRASARVGATSRARRPVPGLPRLQRR